MFWGFIESGPVPTKRSLVLEKDPLGTPQAPGSHRDPWGNPWGTPWDALRPFGELQGVPQGCPEDPQAYQGDTQGIPGSPQEGPGPWRNMASTYGPGVFTA